MGAHRVLELVPRVPALMAELLLHHLLILRRVEPARTTACCLIPWGNAATIMWCGKREEREAYRAPPPKPSITISPLLPWMLKNGCSEMAVGARIDSKIAPLPEENWKTCCDMDGPCAGAAKQATESEPEPATGKGHGQSRHRVMHEATDGVDSSTIVHDQPLLEGT